MTPDRKRRIIVRNGPGPTLTVAIDPPFNVLRPLLCGSRENILSFADGLSEITNWAVVNEVDTLQ